MKKHYIPRQRHAQVTWHGNLAAKLPAIAPLVGVTQAEVDEVVADQESLKYTLAACELYKAKAREFFQQSEFVRYGSGANPAPAPVVLPPAPTVLASGVLNRAADLAVRIKRHRGYTVSLGLDLGIEGTESAGRGVGAKPSLSVTLKSGSPVITWQKGGSESVEIHADRGTGTFTLAAVCTRKQYRDPAPLPPPGTAAVWKYKAAYRIKDEPIGHWSNPVSIAVTG